MMQKPLSPDGEKMLYTSSRDGDIDLYIMDLKTGEERIPICWVMIVVLV
jgi:Tol biopolymer transport system component